MSGKNEASVLLRLGRETSIRSVWTRPDTIRTALRLNQQKIMTLNMATESQRFPPLCQQTAYPLASDESGLHINLVSWISCEICSHVTQESNILLYRML